MTLKKWQILNGRCGVDLCGYVFFFLLLGLGPGGEATEVVKIGRRSFH
jgi:hypothetical protein